MDRFRHVRDFARRAARAPAGRAGQDRDFTAATAFSPNSLTACTRKLQYGCLESVSRTTAAGRNRRIGQVIVDRLTALVA